MPETGERPWEEGRGRDCRRTAAAKRRDVTQPDVHTHTHGGGSTCSHLRCSAEKSRGRQTRTHSAYGSQTDSLALCASRGELNRGLICGASESCFLGELVLGLCAVSFVVASICGHKTAVKGRARRSQ